MNTEQHSCYFRGIVLAQSETLIKNSPSLKPHWRGFKVSKTSMNKTSDTYVTDGTQGAEVTFLQVA